MRHLFGICLLIAGALVPFPALAQDAESLRRQLDEMRRQFEAMKEQYQKSMDAMAERIQRLEAQPPAPAPSVVQPAAPPGPAYAQAPPPGAPTGPPLLLDLARPREPFALYERRGAGQLLFDMGIAGDFIGNLTQRNVQKANAGTFSGRENRFFPREIELNLFGQVDPYARAEVRIEAGEESRGEEISVKLAEATISLMTLPWGTQLKMGQMRNRFGLTNVTHEHDLPFIDRPNVLVRFLGEDGLTEKGFEATWVPALPFFLEFLGGVFNGDNETAFGRGSLKYPLVTGRVRTFFDLDEWGAFQLGASIANGQTSEQLNNQLIGFDAKYKYRPDGWQHALFTVAGEYLYAIRQVNVVDSSADTAIEQTRTRERNGWYVYGELQPFRFGALSRWALGLRYDWTQFPINPGREWAVQPYLSYMPSEFLRFRLGYKHTERSHRDGFTDNGGSARTVDEIFAQATFILGAHPAHPF
ncbi:MAG TPA: OmpH family outer membrane protein [Methylomirabilota bacterium]|nr:OmpH family outer membrane protein [Methylomirabilota bacterium]